MFRLVGFIRDRLRKHHFICEIILLFLLVGIIYFGVKGALVLGFQSTSPMMGVTSDSMTHSGDQWRAYYEERGYDTTEFPFQGGVYPGDLVFVRGVDSSEGVHIGDVVIWQKNSKRIIHRIAIKENDQEGPYFRTRSDKYHALDRKIRSEDIIGKAVLTIPYLGYPSTWF